MGLLLADVGFVGVWEQEERVFPQLGHEPSNLFSLSCLVGVCVVIGDRGEGVLSRLGHEPSGLINLLCQGPPRVGLDYQYVG